MVKVRTKIVNTWPAAATGIAIANALPLSWPPLMTRIVAITLANAASGAIAAPTFIQPNATNSRVPPTIIPVSKSPNTKPIRVQATKGR